ncbi:MAG TPA: V-type ATP synthase subunit F, partial [Gemmatimonadales bacterium]|nr:V-type ATP synthase subunit F [Gemmatimonadales bacterium]
MSYAVRIMCRPEVAAGFLLAGLAPVEAGTPDDAARQLGTLLEHPETGVVLIEDTLYQGLPEDLQRRLARRALPIVVPL